MHSGSTDNSPQNVPVLFINNTHELLAIRLIVVKLIASEGEGAEANVKALEKMPVL